MCIRDRLEIGETKTSQGRRTIRLPPSTVQRLREDVYKRQGVSGTMYLLTPCPAESRSESFINLPPSLTATVVGRKRMCEKTSSLL